MSATLFKLRKTKEYGRGVYATRNIRKGEIIERSPCIIFSKDEHLQFTDTLINFYVFGWPNGGAAETALALGVGSLFNHDSTPNVTYSADKKTQQMVFKTCRAIKKGQQLFINYGYDPKEVRNRWEFKKRREKEEQEKKKCEEKEPEFLGLEASLKRAELEAQPYGVIKNDKFYFSQKISHLRELISMDTDSLYFLAFWNSCLFFSGFWWGVFS